MLLKRTFAAIVCCVGLFLFGCAGEDGKREQSPIEKAPSIDEGEVTDLEPKEAPFPELPKGAGPIDEDAPKILTPTKSGLYYRILRKSNGKKPKATDSVVAHYKGWLDSGKQFDSSYDRGQPTPFSLGGVIKGWTKGLQLVGEGGMIELEIPAKLGYGQRGQGDIPPGATLHFIIELKEVK